jgi:uncharacterized protein
MDDKFYHPSKIFQPMDSVKYEEVSLAVDTVHLDCIFLKPASKPKATILFLHGDSGNVSNYLFMVQPLVADGYQVFMIDFRGYGKSTGTPTHLNIAHDGQIVFDYLLQREDVKNTKLVIYGASIGTQEAVHLTKDNQNKIAALILDGTISSFTDIAVDQSPANKEALIRQNLISPYSAKEDIKVIKNVPKLFIHSKLDEQVPYKEGELVYANALEPKTFFVYEGKHLQAMRADPVDVIKAINKLTITH